MLVVSGLCLTILWVTATDAPVFVVPGGTIAACYAFALLVLFVVFVVTLPLRQQWFAFGARQGQPHFFRQRRRNVSHVDQAQILSRRNSGADQEKGRA